jgi:hypothetical protein
VVVSPLLLPMAGASAAIPTSSEHIIATLDRLGMLKAHRGMSSRRQRGTR